MRWYFVGNTTSSDWPNYCPQVVPDYTITYVSILSYTTTNYCPQVVPDYTITYVIILSYTTTNYCPQVVPDYSFAQAPQTP